MDTLIVIAPIIAAVLGIINTVLVILTKIDVWVAKKDIRKVEVATNSMKDALVKVTGESEHAKGVKQGEQNVLAAEARAEGKKLVPPATQP